MVEVLGEESIRIEPELGAAPARRAVAASARASGFNSFDGTRLVTAASELARNMLTYAGGGTMTIQRVEDGEARGLKLIFADEGPGIDDVETALGDGFTTGSGLGLGLAGARRLAHDFTIDSRPGIGTTVSIVRWLPGPATRRGR